MRRYKAKAGVVDLAELARIQGYVPVPAGIVRSLLEGTQEEASRLAAIFQQGYAAGRADGMREEGAKDE